MTVGVTSMSTLRKQSWTNRHVPDFSAGKRTLLLCFPTFVASHFPSRALPESDALSDARKILAAKTGVVRKWPTAPVIAVQHSGDLDFLHLQETIQFINSHTGLGIDTQVRRKDLGSVSGSLFGGTRLHYRRAPDSGATYARILFPDGDTLSANIFVYKVDIPTGVLFLVLSRSAKGSWSLARQFAEGTTQCFFSAMSLRNKIEVAHIFIRDNVSEEAEKECIHEELVRAMGLLNDAPGSTFFTFDSVVASTQDPQDWKLLRALYAADTAAGDDVDEVLNDYMEIEWNR